MVMAEKNERGKTVCLLDNTIRDGSYALDFCFTPEDTAFLANLLERAGFSFIEIGHGLGLGAYRQPKWQMPQPDAVYLEKARKTVSRARLGVFFIPGIGTGDDLRLGRELGVDFVRIGTNVSESEKAYPFIKMAKKLGYYVASNLMKSYAVPPATFAETACNLKNQGADIVYLVDSAGCMIPNEIREYFSAVRKTCDVPLGFHGHNNLNLATANTVEAVDCGAQMVDCSLAGLGRSAGNASSESVLAVLERKEIATGVDLYLTLDIAERYIKTLFARPEADGIAVTSGLAKFHSGFMDKIMKYAERYQIEPKKLIMASAAINPVFTDDAVIEEAVERILSRNEELVELPNNTVLQYQDRPGSEYIIQNANDSLKALLKGMHILSKKTGHRTVIRLGFIVDQLLETTLSEYCYDDEYFIVGKISMDVYSLTENLMKDLDGAVDFLLMDTVGLSGEQVRGFLVKLNKAMGKTRVFHYHSAKNRQKVLSQLLQNHITANGAKNILIYGVHDDLLHVLISLEARLDKIYFIRGDQSQGAKLVQSLENFCPDFKKQAVQLKDFQVLSGNKDKIDLALLLSEPTSEDAKNLMGVVGEKGAIFCPPHFKVFSALAKGEEKPQSLVFIDTDRFLSSVVIDAINLAKCLPQ